jgi:hypothetical protein
MEVLMLALKTMDLRKISWEKQIEVITRLLK